MLRASCFFRHQDQTNSLMSYLYVTCNIWCHLPLDFKWRIYDTWHESFWPKKRPVFSIYTHWSDFGLSSSLKLADLCLGWCSFMFCWFPFKHYLSLKRWLLHEQAFFIMEFTPVTSDSWSNTPRFEPGPLESSFKIKSERNDHIINGFTTPTLVDEHKRIKDGYGIPDSFVLKADQNVSVFASYSQSDPLIPLHSGWEGVNWTIRS